MFKASVFLSSIRKVLIGYFFVSIFCLTPCRTAAPFLRHHYLFENLFVRMRKHDSSIYSVFINFLNFSNFVLIL